MIFIEACLNKEITKNHDTPAGLPSLEGDGGGGLIIKEIISPPTPHPTLPSVYEIRNLNILTRFLHQKYQMLKNHLNLILMLDVEP